MRFICVTCNDFHLLPYKIWEIKYPSLLKSGNGVGKSRFLPRYFIELLEKQLRTFFEINTMWFTEKIAKCASFRSFRWQKLSGNRFLNRGDLRVMSS